YFTLQEELLKPQAQAVYQPGERIDNLVLQPKLDEERQQVAQALLCAVQPKAPQAWNVNPALGRKQRFDQIMHGVGGALFQLAVNQQKEIFEVEKETKALRFREGMLEEI